MPAAKGKRPHRPDFLPLTAFLDRGAQTGIVATRCGTLAMRVGASPRLLPLTPVLFKDSMPRFFNSLDLSIPVSVTAVISIYNSSMWLSLLMSFSPASVIRVSYKPSTWSWLGPASSFIPLSVIKVPPKFNSSSYR